MEDWKEEEKKKILREKRVQERQTKTFQNVPNRKEREEIEELKRRIEKLVEEGKQKDQKNKLNYDRIKKQCDDLQQRNLELQAEIKTLESVRIHDANNLGKSTVTKSQNIVPTPPQQPKTIVTAPVKSQPLVIATKPTNQSDYEEEEEQEEEEENQSLHDSDEDEYAKIVNIPDSRKVQFAQQLQKSPKQPPKSQPKSTNKLDIMTVSELGRISIKHINKQIAESEFCFDHNRFFAAYV